MSMLDQAAARRIIERLSWVRGEVQLLNSLGHVVARGRFDTSKPGPIVLTHLPQNNKIEGKTINR